MLLDIEIAEAREALRQLRSLARSELLPQASLECIAEAAVLGSQAVVLAQWSLEILREEHPAEAQAAGRMSAELEDEARSVVRSIPMRCECGHYVPVHAETPGMGCDVDGCPCERFEPWHGTRTVAGSRFVGEDGRPTLCECGHYTAVHEDDPHMACAIVGCTCKSFEPLDPRFAQPSEGS